MLSVLSDRRVLAVSAACIIAAIFLFLLATYPSWKAAVGSGASVRSEASAPPPPGAAPQAALADKAGATALSSSAPAPSLPSGPAPAATPATGPAATGAVPTPDVASAAAAPSFDVVRVEPSGDSVIAARAVAGATVVLLDQGKPIARAKADGTGQVAFVPPPLPPGEHSLMLSVEDAGAPGKVSSQSVAVSVPAQPKAPPMVALLQPNEPTRLLSEPAASSAAAPQVSVAAVDVEEMGGVFASGHAKPGSQCRIYLNGSFVADATAGADGRWALKIERGMRPGHYSVRVDELASKAGDVRARAEVPFDYPARPTASVSLLRPGKGQAVVEAGPPTAQPAPLRESAAAVQATNAQGSAGAGTGDRIASAAGTPDATAAAGAPTVVAQLLTTRVVHGDSLWRISRKMLGHGRRYTQIYAANTAQIRDPKLIYPGQIFVMPQAAP